MMDGQQTYTAVQELLFRSWKERLPDIQWSIRMKKVLKGANIDGYALCDMILSQMFIGPNPSSLLISYLKHSICTQMVSHVAVLRSLAKYKNTCVTRPFCMKSLLEILRLCIHKISCLGPPDECLQIAVALLQVVLWLVESICLSLEKIADNVSNPVASNLIQMCELLYTICGKDQTRMLLFVARLEDEALWSQLDSEISSVMTIVTNAAGNKPGNYLEQFLGRSIQQLSTVARKEEKERGDTFKMKLERALESALKVPSCTYLGKYLPSTNSMEYRTGYINCYLNIMIFIETHLTITHDPQLIVDQILLYERLQNIPRKQVYTSLCQGAFLGLVDSSDNSDQIRTFAFFFLKLPQILIYMKQDATNSSLYLGLEDLLKFVSLIDSVDRKHQCDCFQQFLSQLSKSDLLSESQAMELMAKRQASRHAPAEVTQQQHLVIKANSTLPTILKSLEDPEKSLPEEMPNVFHPLMKSFQLVAATSAATNQLKTFSSKLISFNETTKPTVVDGSNSSHIQGALYDITFLMLCLISQEYGIEAEVRQKEYRSGYMGTRVAIQERLKSDYIPACLMVLNNDEESFFERWAQQCLPDELGAKPMYLPLSGQTEQAKIDQLVQLFYTNGDIQSIQMGCEELCHYVPNVVQQTLEAWEHDYIGKDEVQKVANGICSEMFSLGVCSAAWLCSNAVGVDASGDSKVWAFFEMFLEPKTNLKTGFHFNNTERAAMMVTVIEKMKAHSLGRVQESGSNPALASNDSCSILFSKAFQEIMDTRVFTKALQKRLEMIFNMSGVTWICWSVIGELLKLNRRDDLSLAVEAAFGTFQVDNEQLTIALLRRVLPRLLSDPSHNSHITDPRGRSLARLTVWCIASSLTTQNSYRADPKAKENPLRIRKRKRVRGEPDRDSSSTLREDNRPSKLRRLLSIPEDENAASGLNSALGTTTSPLLVPQSSSQLEPLNKAIASLMQLFASILSDNGQNSRTEFIYSFLQEILACGDAVSSAVLQFMPVSMANHLFSTINKNFIQDLALAIGQLESVVARSQAARALCIMER